MLAIFQPDPSRPVTITDPAILRAEFRRWQKRVLISSLLGYALFYFVRKNLSVAMPAMARDLHFSKSDLGLLLTWHGVIYGISKFGNGFIGDRANARVLMVVGLAGSAILNVMFGMGSMLLPLILIWVANGWFQGMGFPPCARLINHWFSSRELATKMSIWNTSHSLGACLILVLSGYLVGAGWRWCFYVPAAICLIASWILFCVLPDTPPSVGMPEVEGSQTGPVQQSPAEFRAMLMDRVFRNKYVWIVSMANFFVYAIRYAVFDWGPTLLTEAKHFRLTHAAWMLAAFEVAGMIGALLAGWLTDRFFSGRAMRVGLISMILATISVYLFWKVPHQTEWQSTFLLCATGFFVYGPQCLVAIAVSHLASKRAAATAIGLTSIFGYASTILSGWGLGKLVGKQGWDAGFEGIVGVGIVGIIFFAAAWPVRGYEAKT
jgi:sugar phosphate permease